MLRNFSRSLCRKLRWKRRNSAPLLGYVRAPAVPAAPLCHWVCSVTSGSLAASHITNPCCSEIPSGLSAPQLAASSDSPAITIAIFADVLTRLLIAIPPARWSRHRGHRGPRHVATNSSATRRLPSAAHSGVYPSRDAVMEGRAIAAPVL